MLEIIKYVNQHEPANSFPFSLPLVKAVKVLLTMIVDLPSAQEVSFVAQDRSLLSPFQAR